MIIRSLKVLVKNLCETKIELPISIVRILISYFNKGSCNLSYMCIFRLKFKSLILCLLLLGNHALSLDTPKVMGLSNLRTPLTHRSLLPRRSGVVLFKLKPKNQLFQLINSLKSAEERLEFPFYKYSNSHLLGSKKLDLYQIDFKTNPLFKSLTEVANSEETFAQKIMETGLVEFAEPDYIIYPDHVANDPKIMSQWYLEKIQAPLAWDITTGNNQVQVLVCDTGVLSSHPDLKENISSEGHNFVDDTSNSEPSGNPHGTLVSGLIGAKGNNGIGIAGINWNIKIIPGKISNDPKGGALVSVMVKCIQWAIDHQIRIVNLSYSGTDSNSIYEVSKSLADHNGLLVYTIGNTSEEVTRPANTYALTVGASDDYDFKPPWSNTGDALDLVAPGNGILSTDGSGDYKSVRGTSYAAPLVTGTAALLISASPERPIKEIRQIILDSVKDLGTKGKDKAFGFGRLDTGKALELNRHYPY